MDMLCDMRMWKEAKTLAETCDSVNLTSLLLRQAKTAEEDGDLRFASELYLVANEHTRAITIMGDHKWIDSLAEVLKLLKKYVSFVGLFSLCI